MIKKSTDFLGKMTAGGFYGLMKTAKDWLVMMSVAALTVGIFKEKDDSAAFAGMVALAMSLALGWYLERREK
jgi:hypothetical protein